MEKKTQQCFERCILQRTGVESKYDSTEPITEKWQGQVIWSGVVHKFRLFNHPDSNFCYAWCESDEDWSTQKINIILDFGKERERPIDALTAVRLHLKCEVDKKKNSRE